MACKEFNERKKGLCNTLFISQLQQAAISVGISGNSLPFIYYVMPLCQVFYRFYFFCLQTNSINLVAGISFISCVNVLKIFSLLFTP